MNAQRRQRPGLVSVLRGPYGILFAGQSISFLGEFGSGLGGGSLCTGQTAWAGPITVHHRCCALDQPS
jgi:hypothetical protein